MTLILADLILIFYRDLRRLIFNEKDKSASSVFIGVISVSIKIKSVSSVFNPRR